MPASARPSRSAERTHEPMSENGYRVLVKEKIADAGVDLLRQHFDVDVRTDMPEEELPGGDRRLRRDRDPLGHERWTPT